MRSICATAIAFVIPMVSASSVFAAPSEMKVCVDVVIREPAKPPAPKVQATPPAGTRPATPAPAPAESGAAADETHAGRVPPAAEPQQEGAAPALPGPTSLQPDGGAPAAQPPPWTPGAYSPVGGAAPRAAPASATYDTDQQTPPSGDVRAESGAQLPLGQAPEVYLKRLFEHYVTHEPGFISASEGCSQRIVVELYPLQVGWAAFARYSGTGREERVDQLLPTELSQFAQRATLALLHDVPIGETVDRDNVLWSDSLHSTQYIRGRNHFVLGVGTQLRAGYFDTAVTDASAANVGESQRKLRLFSPMVILSGYRGVFDQYGVEALGQFEIGTNAVAAKNNPGGGHVDYSGAVGLALHVMRYADARGISSFYYGAGATFELGWFRGIKAEDQRGDGSTSTTLYGGGLDVDALVGYEIMRASAVSFFMQGELNLPAYALKSEDSSARINTWFPGAKLSLGANF